MPLYRQQALINTLSLRENCDENYSQRALIPSLIDLFSFPVLNVFLLGMNKV